MSDGSLTEADQQTPSDAAEQDRLDDTSLYLNREIELLKFQERVLEEARDPENPLLERVRFLSILGANIAEFYMIRIAGLRQMVDAHVSELSIDGKSPREQLDACRAFATDIMKRSRVAYLELKAELSAAGVFLLDYEQLDARQRERANSYYDESVFPVLTPLAFDPGRPFPHISNLSLNLAVLVRSASGEERFARVKVPRGIPRLVDVGAPERRKLSWPGAGKRDRHFVWLDQLIAARLGSLFPGMDVMEAHPFRVTRDAELEIQELEADDLLLTIEQGVRRRRFGAVMRVSVTPDTPEMIRQILIRNLEVDPADVVELTQPLGASDLGVLYDLDRPDLKYRPFTPRVPAALQVDDAKHLFAALREQDHLLHRPFESFDPVIELLELAARDPSVLAIKTTLYRTGRRSPIVAALLDAAREGKEVTALVELKARFDEESNIDWARALEAEGVHVVYGLVGLKIHSKVTLIVRRESGKIRRYVHVGTGNYNAQTAMQYTDLDLLTCHERIAEDASELFNTITGYAETHDYEAFSVSPGGIRDELERQIRREMEHAQTGRGGSMILKTNALTDRRLVRLLFEASQAGVKIDLIIRGICCLRPGIPGVSDNIRVRSILGRFLEHTRIYYFENAGDPVCLIGSADLMSRNLNRRVEVLAPVFDSSLIVRLHNVLKLYLADNVKAREMREDGSYVRVPRASDEARVDAQSMLLEGSFDITSLQ